MLIAAASRLLPPDLSWQFSDTVSFKLTLRGFLAIISVIHKSNKSSGTYRGHRMLTEAGSEQAP